MTKRRKILARVKLYLLVACSAILGMAVAGGIQFLLESKKLSADQNILGNYLQLIGGIYAVVIGFVVFVVWNQFNDSTRTIEKEAGRLSALARLSNCLSNIDEGAEIKRAIHSYGSTILNQLRYGKQREDHGDTEAWQVLVRSARNLSAGSDKEIALYSDILLQIDDLLMLRNERHSFLRARIPWILWDLLVFASFATFIPLCVLSIESGVVNFIMAGSTASSLTFILYVVYDLDNPVRGVFNISTEPLERLIHGSELAYQ